MSIEPKCLCQNVCAKMSVPKCLCQNVCAKTSVPKWLCQNVCVKMSVPKCPYCFAWCQYVCPCSVTSLCTVQFLVCFEIKPVRTALKSCGIHRLLVKFRAYLITYNFQAFFLLHNKKLHIHSIVFF